MTYRWGFDLDMSAVRLMRREGGQWREFAVEKIDGPDIEDRLKAMVAQIDDDEPVELFLPRDQILYDDVTVTSDDSALDDIDRAMNGRTPYALDELEIDWEMTGPDTARVAAIARDTLDEAAAFAEARGLRVSGFSSLADTTDFPRLPDFGGGNLFDAEDESGDESEDAGEIPVQFVTKRETSKPNGPVATLTPSVPKSDQPVVRVDDTMPVMQVKARQVPPLDPGKPITAPAAPPRVRTDIAAAAVSPQAASLTPRAAFAVRRQSGAPIRTVAVFAIALLLTIGIAIVVWNILPLGPGQSARPETPASTEMGLATPPSRSATDPQSEIAAAPAPAQDTVPEPETDVIADPVPELPQPVAITETPTITAPEAGTTPALVSLPPAPQAANAPRLMKALRAGEGLPAYDPEAPVAVSPKALAGILTRSPFPGPISADDVSEDTDDIYIASIERRDLSFDAIALPGGSELALDELPAVQPAPAPADAAPEAPEPDVAAGPEPTTGATSATDAAAQLALSDTADPAATLPRPTEFASALPDRAPRARPDAFVQEIERQKFAGRTRQEMARIRPSRRPESAQLTAVRAREAAPVSDLAVATSLGPRGRPEGFQQLIAETLVQREAARLTASLDYRTPDTSSAIEAALQADAEPEPRPQDTPQLTVPSNASVARLATIDNAIRLNKINLVGIYGSPSDRRALVRLASGRYVKVKVGDRVDGGTVAQITETDIYYRKGNRTLSLSLPKG